MRLTRVRGVPFAGEAVGVGALGGGHETCNSSRILEKDRRR